MTEPTCRLETNLNSASAERTSERVMGYRSFCGHPLRTCAAASLMPKTGAQRRAGGFSWEIATEFSGYVQDPFGLRGGRDIGLIAGEFVEHVADESAFVAVKPSAIAV